MNQNRLISKYSNQVIHLYQSGRNALFSTLFPWNCPCCGSLLPFPQVLCESCVQLKEAIQAPFCKLCGIPFPPHWTVKTCPDCKEKRLPLTQIRSAYRYEGLVREMIHSAKYGGKARMLRFFAEQLFEIVSAEFPRSIRVIVPVPLHRFREWDRKWNQAAFLANEIGRLSGLPVLLALKKMEQTKTQSSLSGAARRANLRGAFNSVIAVPKSVLLVDDVITTGATLSECARVLRKAGACRVHAVTIARTVLRC